MKKHYKLKRETLSRAASLIMAIMLTFGIISSQIPRTEAAVSVPLLDAGITPLSATVTSPVRDLIVNVGSDQSELNFAWYCEDTVTGTPSIKVNGGTPVPGTQSAAETGFKTNKVTITGLAPDSTYSIEISSDGITYSGAYTLKTPKTNAFTFAAVGDPQIGCTDPINNDASIATDTASWDISVAKMLAKGASFIATTGDQIEDANQNPAGVAAKQKEYTGYSSGLVQGTQIIPVGTTIGNHEAEGGAAQGYGRNIFGYHYNLPNTVQDETAFDLVNYYYKYNNILFVVLDTAPYPANTTAATPYVAAYDATLLAATTDTNMAGYEWLIVQTHKTQETNASHWNDTDIKAYSAAGFEDLMTEYNVDLVLTGHDHSYTRTKPFTSSGGPTVADGAGVTFDEQNFGDALVNPQGTVYLELNSSTGSKYYGLQSTLKFTSEFEYQSNKPEYTIIDVTPGKLSIATYEIGGNSQAIDSFTITKRTDSTTPPPPPPPSIPSAGTSDTEQEAVTPPWVNPFTDVKESDWFYGDVEYIYSNKLMFGESANLFAPNATLTRGMVITILYRADGTPDATYMANVFDDVREQDYYYDACKWGVVHSVIAGRGAGVYDPNAPVTREELAAILARYARYKHAALPVIQSYTAYADDGLIAGWAKPSVINLYNAGVITGTAFAAFNPQGNATRAEAAQWLHRLLTAIEK